MSTQTGKNRLAKLNGLLAVDKPSGYLSNDILEHIKMALTIWHQEDIGSSRVWTMPPELKSNVPVKDSDACEKHRGSSKRKFIKWPFKDVKIGHGGTLDPLASGVLIVGIGGGTKSLQTFLNGNQCVKTYDAVGQLGLATDTYDSTGKPVGETMPYAHITTEAMKSMIREKFSGEILQKPPTFSAIRVNGKRLYDLARSQSTEAVSEAQAVAQAKMRPVQIFACDLVGEEGISATGQFRLRITCGGGTYIRSIIHDLAQELGSAAHMTELIRVRQGPFTLAPKEDGTNGEETIISLPVLSVDEIAKYESLRDFMDQCRSSVEKYLSSTRVNKRPADFSENLPASKRPAPHDEQDGTANALIKDSDDGRQQSMDSKENGR